MLHINSMTYRIEGRPLFEEATVAIAAGTRVALIGRNGSGKTTLLALIRGEVQPDGGSIQVRSGARLVSVAQRAPSGSASPLDTVLDADQERRRLLTEAETETDPARIAEIQTRLADIGAHAAESRAASILHGLGFNTETQRGPLDSLSGGWRMRVALAAALFADADLLLLDEPTNHLDLEATIWLESHLARLQRTLLLVSHDRNVINRVASHTLHLHERRLRLYRGGFDAFIRARDEQLAYREKQRARQVAERKRITQFVDRFRASATKAKQAQSRLKALARLAPIAAEEHEQAITLTFPDPVPLASPLLRLDEASVGYEPDRPVLSDLSLRIDLDDRIALLGANGNGKTTLLRLLSGALSPLSGERVTVPKLRVGYYTQDQEEMLVPGQTALDHIGQRMTAATETAKRAHLGGFGLGATLAETAAGDLSGGERARLLFALMSLARPHILLLDEPTNHLDLESREALVLAINSFKGAVILITHDRHLVELCADRLWLVHEGRCLPYEDDLNAYETLIRSRNRKSDKEDREPPATGTDQTQGERRASRKENRRTAAARRKEIAPLRRAATEAEKRLDRFLGEKQSIEASLANPKIYESPARVTVLNRRQAELAREIASAEETWLKAQAELEGNS